MHCSKARLLLHLYIDKRLTLMQVRALELHLSHCSSCQHELFSLEALDSALRQVTPVAVPPDLAANIMRRVAFTPQQSERASFVLQFPSLAELATVVLLATVVTLGVILGQPTLREALPFANGHDPLSLAFLSLVHSLIAVNGQTLMLGFWVLGTILGIWITFLLAGHEVRRTEWFRSVKNRLPVW